ncbi:YraN family protein [Helicobacter didelphidarum]|uniref:UPF0102 protein CQA53_02010 n=1 Tax=Helicobacter didelphidarum TaxID=2040648 RepID=A0A3D8IP40_9HELI|nr:YraN family protein [Helicobacter didelphidarum]RDU67057.1 YraN family protein [Helicobacter didelphidarum]
MKNDSHINKKKNARYKGNYYENIALQYMIDLGFVLIKKNFYSRYGEIDLIMQKDNILHFIEVKSSSSFHPLYNITHKKLEKLTKTIHVFLEQQNSTAHFCLDAISIHNNQIVFIENITL